MSRYVSFRDFDWVLLIFVLLICGLGSDGNSQRHHAHQVCRIPRQADLLGSGGRGRDVRDQRW
jgi:hypothetical protein